MKHSAIAMIEHKTRQSTFKPTPKPKTEVRWNDERLSPQQQRTAFRLVQLWDNARIEGRSVTAAYDSCGGTGEISDRRAADNKRLKNALLAMRKARSDEVIGWLIFDEDRDMELVLEGLDMAEDALFAPTP